MCKDNIIVGPSVGCETHAFGLSILQIAMLLTVEKNHSGRSTREYLETWKCILVV